MGMSPDEIDRRNKLNKARDASDAAARAQEEAEKIRLLGMRDVAYANTADTRLRKPRTAIERALGRVPSLGQARHRYY
jgi:LmbE family N-acetylglucosaminyl deacetylase